MNKKQPRHAFTDKVANLSDDALNKVDEVVENVQSQTQKYSDIAQDYVQKSPLKALGIAAAAGAILALLIRK